VSGSKKKDKDAAGGGGMAQPTEESMKEWGGGTKHEGEGLRRSYVNHC
jgi:hypothetical protein